MPNEIIPAIQMGHDGGTKMRRRSFLATLLGALFTKWRPKVLTRQEITREELMVLENSVIGTLESTLELEWCPLVPVTITSNEDYLMYRELYSGQALASAFGPSGPKIFDTIFVRKPKRLPHDAENTHQLPQNPDKSMSSTQPE